MTATPDPDTAADDAAPVVDPLAFDASAERVAPPAPPTLGARRALLAFLVFVVGQIVVAVVIGLGAGIWFAVSGDSSDAVSRIESAMIPIALIGALVAGWFVLRMVRRSFPGPSGAGALAPLGWTGCSRRHVVVAALLGLALGVSWVVVLAAEWVVLPEDAGPMSAAMLNDGWLLACWSLFAFVIAPVVEEFVYRGVIFTGLQRGWGTLGAGVGVTLLFVVSHMPQVLQPPIAVVLSVMATLVLVLRQRTGSLLPAIVAHAAYNSVLVAVAVLAYFAETA